MVQKIHQPNARWQSLFILFALFLFALFARLSAGSAALPPVDNGREGSPAVRPLLTETQHRSSSQC
jgi:hypothetical protein